MFPLTVPFPETVTVSALRAVQFAGQVLRSGKLASGR